MQSSQSSPSGVLLASLNLSSEGIVVFDPILDGNGQLLDMRLELMNDTAVQIFGLSRDVATGRRLTELWNMEAEDPEWRMVKQVMLSGKPLQYEWFTDHLGGRRWFEVTLRQFGSDGFAALYREITDKKHYLLELEGQKAELEQKALLLNAVLDSSPMATVVYESVRNEQMVIEDFRPVIANKLALEISGYDAEQFLKQSFFTRNPDKKAELLPKLQEIVEGGKSQTHEHQVPATGRWVRSITTPFGDGFIATSQDITEQKLQSAQMEEQALLFNSVLRSLQNGLTVFGIIRNDAGDLEDLVYLQIADSVERNTGMTREQMIGKRIRTLFPGIEKTDYWKAYSAVAKTAEPYSFETHFTLPGYDNHLLNWVTPIGGDKLLSVYYIVNDLKKAQRELEHTVQELRRSNEDLEQFASIASHDLQEPLRKVESFGAMLESRYAAALGEQGRDLLQRMQSAAGRMRNLVSGLLAFARLSGDEDVPLKPVDLNQLISEVQNDLDETLRASGGSIHIPERLPFVQGLESQLRHLFHNLLTNALKFRKENVRPEVSVTFGTLTAGDTERVSPLFLPEDYVRLEVSDNGIGFEPEFAEKIFGLFERLHGVNEYKGTGLGLSICRRVAERHQGAIWAESEPGKGATFIVLLQRAK